MSRFISAGTDETLTERDEAWRKAQQELEAKQVQKAEADKQDGGKSLYETLQSNKAAKQEAFEEANRLQNQFRSLDEDEIEFLDSVMESTRAKEAKVKKETLAELEAFRRQQEEAEKAAQLEETSSEAPVKGESWAAGPRKRKKGREGVIGGVKLRRTSTNEKQAAPSTAQHADEALKTVTKSAEPYDEARLHAKAPDQSSTKAEDSIKPGERDEGHPKPFSLPVDTNSAATKSASPPATALGLAAYSSDEDD